MGLFPEVGFNPTSSFVSTHGPGCEAGYNTTLGGGVAGSNTLAQNRLFLMTVEIETPTVFVEMGWHNGATSAGNCAAGIYTLSGIRLDYTAQTAQGTVSVAQGAALTNANVRLMPGLYYFCFGSDSATATFWRSGANLNLLKIWGMAQVAAGYANPLPATITPAWPLSGSLCPVVWASTVSVQ